MKNLLLGISFLILSLLMVSCKSNQPQATSGQEITTLAFGSCNRQNLPQPLWKPILADQPDLWIWMGDNIYGDSPIMDTLKAKYDRQNSVADYQTLKSQTKVIGIWDDHDYGINDGGKFFAQKKASRDLMFDFLGVPGNAPERSHEGAYSSHLYGKGEDLVKVILLDARYFRDTLERINRVYQINENGEVLGDAQWNWLENELKNSPAKVNLIVSGIQMLPTEHAYEKWANFPKERERLLDLIAKSGAKTPILLSGDRHIAEVMKLTDSRFPEGIYEITSSGLTHTWNTLSEEKNSYRVSDLIAKLNYGLATFDWKKGEVTFQVKGEGGATYATQVIDFK
ncbi:alkaline phosphatase family protein [Algoriphagus lacus]|uniref:Alkaline phosphatase family protein n=1 Tax=Algoriphagus lacus TaxID=2056311 RepID=A0A418PSM8_9BACT|nr:alkaline phosphatase D family protein [Algoriphagus lacus]RIW15815.1 alkaline phosphatase family protein [Algoriphagus lacus]